jgi:hypothetical protein
VSAGHYLSIQKAKDRLALLNAKGETAQAFTLKKAVSGAAINYLITQNHVLNHLHGGIIPALADTYPRSSP